MCNTMIYVEVCAVTAVVAAIVGNFQINRWFNNMQFNPVEMGETMKEDPTNTTRTTRITVAYSSKKWREKKARNSYLLWKDFDMKMHCSTHMDILITCFLIESNNCIYEGVLFPSLPFSLSLSASVDCLAFISENMCNSTMENLHPHSYTLSTGITFWASWNCQRMQTASYEIGVEFSTYTHTHALIAPQ